jgi:DNA-binding response OmpR family regulator
VARVLIIEDEPLIAMMLQDWLGEMGYEAVGPAGSVEDAIAMIDGSQLDAALLDLHLRGVHAVAVAERLRSAGVPFAVATGDMISSPKDQLDGTPRLAKPYDYQTLQSTLAALLQQT